MPENNTPSLIARLAMAHALMLAVGLAWRFGGMDPLGRFVAGCILVPAPLLTILAWLKTPSPLRRRIWWVLVPFALLGTVVIVSALNPSMREQEVWGSIVLRPEAHRSWLPSAMIPRETIADFAFVGGLLLVGVNLLLSRPPRTWLHGLLTILMLNAAVLAVVGTVYKLAQATKILGHTPSPNPNFFATFVYHNHWGGFALMAAAAAFGMAFRHERRRTDPIAQTPVPFYVLVGTLLLFTLPLSSGRASMIAGGLLALGLGGFTVGHLRRHRMGGGPTIAGLLAAVVIGGTGLLLAKESVRHELRVSREQLGEINAGSVGDRRRIIYSDTLKLIGQQPVWGWGWNSFPHAYRLVQTPMPGPETRYAQAYILDAHCDWLEFTAETGLVGLILWVALFGGWVAWAGRGGWSVSPAREILVGAGALAALAVVDFPAANPALALNAIIIVSVAAELGRTGRMARASTT